MIKILKNIRKKIKKTTVENIIWWLNLTPEWLGFSVATHKNSVLFWTIHFALMSYINFISNFVYRLKLSTAIDEIVQANTNLSIVIFTTNSSLWFMFRRSLLLSTLEKVKEVDKLTSKTKELSVKHHKFLRIIKIFVLVYYAANFSNTYFVWMPQRMDLSSAFYTPHPCPGINITTVINKYICRGLIFAQDVTIATVVLNFQCLILFLISHTSAMYHLMSEEMLALSKIDYSTNRIQVKKKLSLLIKRHTLLLNIVQCLGSLYNLPIGVNFGANAFCICLFFFLNLEAWITFGPLLGYCFLVFFMYCYLCQKLIDASEEFERSVYACGWESYGLKDMKAIFIVLKQAQQPALLLAGDMIPVNIYTFATGMQFIYKFVTTLKV